MNNFFDEKLSRQMPPAPTDGPANDEDPPDQETEESYTPQNIKSATQELMKFGLLEMERKPKLYQTALTHHQDINTILSPLDLKLKIDDIRGLAFLIIADNVFSEGEEGDWSHPLIRRQRLTLEQTLLIAILRQYYVAYEQESGAGAGGAVIDVDDLKPQFFAYIGGSGSETGDHSRLIKLLEQLHAYSIVSEINEKAQVSIRPIITHMANPETLQLLLQHLRKLTGKSHDDEE